MTRFIESAQRTVSKVATNSMGWIVTFADGSCRLIATSEKKGSTPFKPGMIVMPCSSRCSGPDTNGNCTLRNPGPHTEIRPLVQCHEQFIYVHKPYDFDRPKPKFHRSLQKYSYKINWFSTTRNGKWYIQFENGTTKVIEKSEVLCKKNLHRGYHLVPCDQECVQRGGICPYCHGERKDTECEQQFYFCRKYLSRHKYDKQK